MLVNVDVRCLQDSRFAEKGIGQHTLYLLSLLRGMRGLSLMPIADPLLGHIQRSVDSLFDTDPIWIDWIDGDVYFNPPLPTTQRH